ncbi:YkgJ family cysteine cluster protein, partial [Corynebacterium propinquum]
RRSRQADRDDVQTKAAVCALLGIRTTALKGDGFTAYLPDMHAFTQAIELAVDQPYAAHEWVFHVSGMDIAEQVLDAGAQIVTEVPANYAFISLRAA